MARCLPMLRCQSNAAEEESFHRSRPFARPRVEPPIAAIVQLHDDVAFQTKPLRNRLWISLAGRMRLADAGRSGDGRSHHRTVDRRAGALRHLEEHGSFVQVHHSVSRRPARRRAASQVRRCFKGEVRSFRWRSWFASKAKNRILSQARHRAIRESQFAA